MRTVRERVRFAAAAMSASTVDQDQRRRSVHTALYVRSHRPSPLPKRPVHSSLAHRKLVVLSPRFACASD